MCTVLYTHAYVLYTHTCVLYTHACVLYTHTCVLYTHAYVLYTHTCVLYTHAYVLYTHTATATPIQLLPDPVPMHRVVSLPCSLMETQNFNNVSEMQALMYTQ